MATLRIAHLAGASAAIIVSIAPFLQAAGFAGGTGEPNDPYQIAAAQQLVSIGSDPNLLDKHFVLIADLDLDPNLPDSRVFTQAVIAADMHWTRYGDVVDVQHATFDGSFDGGGHIVRNLVIDDVLMVDGVAPRCVGLFGIVGERGRVQNLRLEGISVKGLYPVGGLAGNNAGTILRCHVVGQVAGSGDVGGLAGSNGGVIALSHTGGVVSGGDGLGGLVGGNLWGIVTNCYSDATVCTGHGRFVGGLIGDHRGSLAGCYATGSVSVGERGMFVGGLVGSAWGSVVNCHAAGSVLSGDKSECVGGLVGDDYFNCIIANCYATGRILAGAGSQYVGGLLGRSHSAGDVSQCFWDVEATGILSSDGGTGLATIEMQRIQTYQAAGWDWVDERANGTADLWLMAEAGSYPKLAAFSNQARERTLMGSGTHSDPYRIASAEDVGAISRYDPSACYRLETDIDMSGIAWATAPIAGLDGSLDGAGHAVSNLTIRGGGYLGLFGILARRGHVAGVILTDADVGATGPGCCFGMLVGHNSGSIAGCGAMGAVGGWEDAGGLAGTNDGVITACFATSDIFGAGKAQELGGFVGHNDIQGQITNCYARGNVSGGDGSQRLGGFVGYNEWEVADCYVAGNVSGGQGSRDLGKFVGKHNSVNRMPFALAVKGCYFLRPMDDIGPTNNLGHPLFEEDMKKQSRFVGWDFGAVWMICEGRDYPRLRWEQVQCQP